MFTTNSIDVFSRVAIETAVAVDKPKPSACIIDNGFRNLKYKPEHSLFMYAIHPGNRIKTQFIAFHPLNSSLEQRHK